MPHTVPATPRNEEQVTGPARFLTYRARTNKADGSESRVPSVDSFAVVERKTWLLTLQSAGCCRWKVPVSSHSYVRSCVFRSLLSTVVEWLC